MKYALALLVVTACGGGTKPKDKDDAAIVKSDDGGAALPQSPPIPELPAGLPRLELPASVTPDLVVLGELLFWDTRLAIDNTTSCATCHIPENGFAGRKRQNTATGKPNLRRAPSLVDLAWHKEFGWDGRYTALADHLPAHATGQLGNDLDAAMARIGEVAGYRAHFTRIGAPANGNTATAALAAFVMTRFAGNSQWDRLERSPDIPADLKAGFQLFTGRGQCSVCHTPPLYTDLRYHRIGLIESKDEGRGRVDDTQKGAFKTPSLRGAATRDGFFHDGSASTIEQAIDWHIAGGTGQKADPSIVEIKKLVLTPAERDQLIAFVRALTDPRNLPSPTKPTLP